MRGLTKTGTKEELAVICFSALHHKMVFYRITRGATGISDPLQMFSGRLDEHDGMRFWPPIFLTDITQFLLAHGDAALTNDMLKDYKVDKVYEYCLSR